MYRSEILLYNLSLIYINLYRENELTEKVWYFKVYTLVGPTVKRQVQDPLAVLSLEKNYENNIVSSSSASWIPLILVSKHVKAFCKQWPSIKSKLMRTELSNPEWPFLRLLDCFWLPKITVIVRYMISEIDDAWCIVADL